LGEIRRDLERLFRGEKIDSNSRFIEPILRGDFIYRIRDYLSAGMDISDGLFCDTDKLLGPILRIKAFNKKPLIKWNELKFG